MRLFRESGMTRQSMYQGLVATLARAWGEAWNSSMHEDFGRLGPRSGERSYGASAHALASVATGSRPTLWRA